MAARILGVRADGVSAWESACAAGHRPDVRSDAAVSRRRGVVDGPQAALLRPVARYHTVMLGNNSHGIIISLILSSAPASASSAISTVTACRRDPRRGRGNNFICANKSASALVSEHGFRTSHENASILRCPLPHPTLPHDTMQSLRVSSRSKATPKLKCQRPL